MSLPVSYMLVSITFVERNRAWRYRRSAIRAAFTALTALTHYVQYKDLYPTRHRVTGEVKVMLHRNFRRTDRVGLPLQAVLSARRRHRTRDANLAPDTYTSAPDIEAFILYSMPRPADSR